MIRIQHLHFFYESHSRPVLRDINLEIRTGDYAALVGPNGCGKTTLIRHLNGLLMPCKGEVWIDDLSTRENRILASIRQQVGMVFQNPDNQMVGTTVEEDVAFGPGNLNLAPVEIRKRVDQALALVGMTHHSQSSCQALSGGEKQLVALAGVLAMHPRYIVLDEPTSHLDPLFRRRILQVVRDLHRQGITIIHVTHNMDEIVQAQRIVVMDQGKIVLDDKPAIVFSKYEWLQKIGLDVPKINALLWQLRQRGIDLSPDILDTDDACQELCRIIKPECRKGNHVPPRPI